METKTIKRSVDYRVTSHRQEFKDAIGEQHQAVYMGKCIICGRNVYGATDWHNDTQAYGEHVYDPDPRGTIDYLHSAKTLEAWEYGKIGRDVLMCAADADDSDKYNWALLMGLKQWKDKEGEN